MAVQTQIQTRRGTAASWTSTNPTLAAGEIGFESDTGKIKIGTGSTAWNALAYTASSTAVTYLFNATAAQTTFSGTDANGLTLAYTVGSEQVYLNGVLQVRGSDYTATNGTSIVLTSGALVSDVLNVIAFSALALSDTYTQAQADAKFFQTANSTFAGKNKIINGDTNIWQRGTSIAVTSGSAQVYTADRWWYANAASGMSGTVSRQATGDTTNLPFIQYCARVQRTAGNTSTLNQYFAQDIETINSIPFAGKTVTVSWYARKGADYSTTSSFLSYQVRSGTGTDQSMYSGYTGSTNLVNANVTLTTTWQRFTATVAVGSTATQLGVFFFTAPTGTAGANDYFEITGIQMEAGSIATPFQTATGTIQGELAACQRYLPAVLGNGNNFLGVSANTNDTRVNVPFVVMPRVAPTGLTYSSLSHFSLTNPTLSSGTPTSLTFVFAGTSNATIGVSVGLNAPTIAAGTTVQVSSGNSAAQILFTGCEL